MILNNPNCKSCADYGFTPASGTPTGTVPMAPGALICDKGPITLVANVPKTVLFTLISVIDATGWTFSGQPLCYNSANESIGWEITAKSGTGFTVVAMDDSIFEFMAIKK